ncbi:hypothetical protein ACFWHT_05390 [Microbacterium sp. NPDC058342]|uniref:hypothetical protein n=1 Tax=Microbacterium sp. NPDC058342 TaxID=3346454 RepID=UPI0036478CCA
MSGQTWTPAPKRGAIPLHPMPFGTILGRAFAALRHNPKVLFGFAVVVQFAVGLVTAGVLLLVGWFIAARIASVPVSSPDYGVIVAGSIALGGAAAILMALATVAFTAVVQGLVAADVSYAALSRKASLRMLWGRVRPAFWRLFAYSLLQSLAVLIWVAIIFSIVFSILSAGGFRSAEAIAIAVGVGLLAVLGSIPLFIWLTVKLLVVPSVLVLEGATLRTALVRSWRLIRGRFWPAFGITALIGLIMGLAVQVVAFPASILSTVLTGLLAPTGASEPTEYVGVIAVNVLPQVLVLAVQAISIVVQGTGATLIYLDSRMRYEALDQALIRHVDLSAQGTPDDQLGDPYVVDPARAVSSAPPPAQTAYGSPTGFPAYPAQQPYPGQQPYPAQPYPAPQQPYAGHPYPAQQPYPAQPYPAPQSYPAQPYPGQAPSAPPAPAPPATERSAPRVIPPTSTSPWAPPGGDA